MRKVFLKPGCLVLSAAVLLSSCASIVSSSSYPVYIHTNPAGVTVSITDKKGVEVYKGQSPAHVSLKSGSGYFAKAQYQVKLSSRGMAEKIIPIRYKINSWYFGNLLLGGVIGLLIVDPATGAMWKVATPVISEDMVQSTASNSATPTLDIVNMASISKEMKSKLVRIN